MYKETLCGKFLKLGKDTALSLSLTLSRFPGIAGIFGALAFFSSPAFADITVKQNVDLGSWTFLDSSALRASFTLEPNGNITNASNITVKNTRVGIISIGSETSYTTDYIGAGNYIQETGCLISLAPKLSEKSIPPRRIIDIKIGVEVYIENLSDCQKGTVSDVFPIFTDELFANLPFTYTLGETKSISLREIQPLDFGELISPETAASYSVNPQTGIGSGTAQQHASPKLGIFRVNGDANTPYQINPVSEVRLENDTRTQTLAATLATISNARLNATGEDSVYVGGTLTIPSHSQAGTYSSTYSITVNY